MENKLHLGKTKNTKVFFNEDFFICQKINSLKLNDDGIEEFSTLVADKIIAQTNIFINNIPIFNAVPKNINKIFNYNSYIEEFF